MNKIVRINQHTTAVLIQRKELQNFSAFLFVGQGAIHDPASLPGLHHFLEHLRVDDLIQRHLKEVDSLKIDAWTDLLFTKYSVVGPHSQLNAGLGALASCCQSIHPTKQQLEKIKKHILQEIHQRNHESWILLQRKWRRAIFKDPALHHSALGSVEMINQLKVSEVQNLINAHLAQANNCLVIVSPKPPSLKTLQRYFQETNPQEKINKFKKKPVKTMPVTEKPVSSGMSIATGYRLIKSSEQDVALTLIIKAYLGEGWNARLSSIWRGEQNQSSLAYHLSVALHWLHEEGYLRFASVISAKNREKYLQHIHTAVEEIANTPLTNTQLRQAKQRVFARFAQIQDSPALLAEWWGEYILSHQLSDTKLELQSFDRCLEQVQNAKSNEILLYSQKNFIEENRRTVTEYL